MVIIGLGGIVAILLAGLLLSVDRRAIRPRVVGAALALQAFIGFLVLYVPAGRRAIGWLAQGVEAGLGCARSGIDMVFGGLSQVNGVSSLAINVLPVIIFFSCLVSILYFLGIMQLVVRCLGGIIGLLLGVSRVEGLNSVACVMVGQSEAPLVVRPYLAGLSEARIFAVMTAGMASASGSVLAAYSLMGIKVEFLLAASFMAAPGGLLMAKIIMPDGAARAPVVAPEAIAELVLPTYERPANIVMAAYDGVEDGLRVAVSCGAMLVGFVGVITLANAVFGAAGGLIGFRGLTFQGLLGQVFAPLMRLLNVPGPEAAVAGQLFGEKLVLNEFVAYLHYARIAATLSPRTQAVITFALCGFANFSSIAIQLGVLGGLLPQRRAQIARFGLRAVAAASLSNLMSAAIASLLMTLGG